MTVKTERLNAVPTQGQHGHAKSDLDSLEFLDREDLIKMIRTLTGQGVALTFHGKRSAMEIAKRVRPRVTRRVPELCVGAPEEQAQNLIIEGENLQAMVTLYKYRGQIDLIVTDPPYNTGQQFRYNDRWDTDPNDPDLGVLVTKEDGSRHTKWMKAMMPRLQMMKAMLKPNGVIAMCIDDNELFHLGMMMDEVFGENNRLAIINWQKASAPKNDKNHVSTTTEYVLVYAKDANRAVTNALPRDEGSLSRYKNPDNDPRGLWREHDLTARTPSEKDQYGIQSPFTGVIHYPAGTRSWAHPKRNIKSWLEEWGVHYVLKKIGDGRPPALMVEGGKALPPMAPTEARPRTQPGVLPAASKQAPEAVLKRGQWPFIWFGLDGSGGPRTKKYLEAIRKGFVPVTYWADDEYNEPLDLSSTSWEWEQSGLSQSGIKELNAIIGPGHGFQTVKPLKLIKKIIQIWCPPNGLVLDPYAGSGTTGHALLELNQETGTERRFVLIEYGAPETGDRYARTLTDQRVKRAITGERPDEKGHLTVAAEPLGGGFEFRMLTKQIDAKTVLSMKKDELVDVVITSHWETGRRNSPSLIRVEDSKYTYLVGKNEHNEGYFIIWNGGDKVGQLDMDTYRTVLADAKKAGLNPPYHVYARYEVYQSPSVTFYKIPDKILAHLGLNENSDRFNEDEGEDMN